MYVKKKTQQFALHCRCKNVIFTLFKNLNEMNYTIHVYTKKMQNKNM